MTDKEKLLIEALLEYVERYGMSDSARDVFNKIGQITLKTDQS